MSAAWVGRWERGGERGSWKEDCADETAHARLARRFAGSDCVGLGRADPVRRDLDVAVATIVDTFGNVVSHHEVTSPKFELDIKSLTSGTYFLELKAENKFARVQFVKQ